MCNKQALETVVGPLEDRGEEAAQWLMGSCVEQVRAGAQGLSPKWKNPQEAAGTRERLKVALEKLEFYP